MAKIYVKTLMASMVLGYKNKNAKKKKIVSEITAQEQAD